MKRVFFLLVIFLIGATLIMCSSEQKQEATVDETTEEATSTTVSDTSMALCAAGCGMEVEKAKMVSHEMDGEKHYFCSEMCKENYLASKKEEKKEM
jgi:YHS domain-containing protein